MTTDVPYIFESHYLAYEIMPAGNLDFVRQQFSYLEELEEDERNSWEMVPQSEQYFRTRPIGNKPILTESLHIPANWLDALLSAGLTRFHHKNIQADYGGLYTKAMQAAGCYGLNGYAIFFSQQDNLVTHIWLGHYNETENHPVPQALLDALALLATTHPCILADWYEKAIIDLANKQAVKEFLTID